LVCGRWELARGGYGTRQDRGIAMSAPYQDIVAAELVECLSGAESRSGPQSG